MSQIVQIDFIGGPLSTKWDRLCAIQVSMESEYKDLNVNIRLFSYGHIALPVWQHIKLQPETSTANQREQCLVMKAR